MFDSIISLQGTRYALVRLNGTWQYVQQGKARDMVAADIRDAALRRLESALQRSTRHIAA